MGKFDDSENDSRKAILLFKKICVFIIIIILAVACYFRIVDVDNGHESESQKVVNEDNVKLETEVVRSKLDENIIKTNRLIDNVLNETELILYAEYGTYEFEYHRHEEKWYNGIVKSNITMSYLYYAIFSIPTEKINFENNFGVLSYTYDVSDVYCKAIELSNPLVSTDKGLFGSRYSEIEIANMVDIEQGKLKDQLNANIDVEKASNNLNDYIQRLCDRFDVEFGGN